MDEFEALEQPGRDCATSSPECQPTYVHSRQRHARTAGTVACAHAATSPARLLATAGLALALCCALTGLSACGSNNAAQEGTSDSPASTEEAAQEPAVDLPSFEDARDASEKSETVHIKAKASGKVQEVKVDCTLKNTKKADALRDISQLDDIESDDDTAFAAHGTKLVWDAQGNNVEYSGTSSADVPVTIKATYWLDGKKTKPADLVGKSGHVKVRYRYKNSLSRYETVHGKRTLVYTPLVAVTGIVLDNDVFTKVKSSDGRVLDDGGNTVVAGIAAPGLAQTLDPSGDLGADTADELTFEADVKGFKLGTSITYIGSDLLDDSGNTFKIDLDEMDDALGALEKGMGALVKGGQGLSSGIGKLGDGAAALGSGLDEAAKGSKALAAGLAETSDKTGELSGATGKVAEGLDKVKSGIDAVNKGWGSVGEQAEALGAIAAQLEELASTTTTDAQAAEQLKARAAELAKRAEGLAGAAKQGAEGLASASSAIGTSADDKTLASALAQIESGASGLASGLSTAAEQAEGLSGGIEALQQGAQQLSQGAGVAKSGAGALVEGLRAYDKKGIRELADTFDDKVKGMSKRYDAMKDASGEYTNFSGSADGVKASVKFVYELAAIEEQGQ